MDRSTVMHNESVLTLFDPMAHTPGRYVVFFIGLLVLSVDTIQGIREELEADPDAS
jgi:hypothetical protein